MLIVITLTFCIAYLIKCTFAQKHNYEVGKLEYNISYSEYNKLLEDLNKLSPSEKDALIIECNKWLESKKE